jgi:hypothetical protein
MLMVKREVAGSLEAGDVRCMYYQLLNSQLTIYPRCSLVLNNGHDGSGEHCGRSSRFHHNELWDKEDGFRFDDNPQVDAEIMKANYVFRKASYRAKFVAILRRIGVYPLFKILKDKIRMSS